MSVIIMYYKYFKCRKFTIGLNALCVTVCVRVIKKEKVQ